MFFKVFIVFNTLWVLVIPILDISSCPTFIVRFGSTFEILIIIFHIDVSLRISIPIPVQIRIHFTCNCIFIRCAHVIVWLQIPTLMLWFGAWSLFEVLGLKWRVLCLIIGVKNFLVDLMLSGINLKVILSDLITKMFHFILIN